MCQTKDERAHESPPHVDQSPDNHDEKSFDDESVIHPQSNTHCRGNQSSSHPCKVTPNDEGDGKDPTDIDSQYSHHLPIHCRCAGDFSYLRFIREEPNSNSHKGSHN